MNLNEYKNKRTNLLNEMQTLIDNGEMDKLEDKKTEITQLDDSFENYRQAQADLDALKDGGVKLSGVVDGQSSLENSYTEKEIDASSDAYRTAFLKHLMNRDAKMTELENVAFTHTTSNTSAPLPTTMVNKIWNNISKQHCIMEDITVYRTGTTMEVVKHTKVTAGKAKSMAEGVANDDENNTFVKVTLSGKDFAKTIRVSYAMMQMSIDALEQYLINEISSALGEAMADDIIATIESGITSGNKVNSAAPKTVSFKEMAELMGKLKRAVQVSVYASRATIYKYLVGMTDASGRPVYQPSAQDPQSGFLLGAAVRTEDSVADNKILVGDPKKVVYNMVEDIMVERDKEITTHEHIFSGYARGEGALMDDASFAELTVTQA